MGDDEDPTMSAAAARRRAVGLVCAVVALLVPGASTSVAATSSRSDAPGTGSAASLPAVAGAPASRDAAALHVSDPMSRQHRGGWGSSGISGPWQVSEPAERFGVDGAEGSVVAVPGARSSALLPQAIAVDTRTLVRVVVPRLPEAGTLQVAVVTRAAGTRRYEHRLVVDPRGGARLLVVRVDGVGPSSRVGRVVRLPDPVRAGQWLDVRVQTTGSSPVVLAARVWPVGTSEPSWQLVARDRSAQRLLTAGALGLDVSAERTRGPVTVRVDGIRAVDLAGRDDIGVVAPERPSPAPALGSRPTAATTGVPEGTVLTVVHGDVVVTKPGTVLDGLDVRGFVIVRAPDVTVRRSVVRGRVATGNIGLITADHPAVRDLRIEDVDLVPTVPSVWVDGIKGAGFSARRVDVRGTVDAVKVYGDHVRVEASYLHDTTPFAEDPNQHGGPSHNDGVQVLSGRDITIVGNDIRGGSNAALQVTQDHGAVTDLEFTGNWVDGGGCSVNLATKGRPSLSGLVLAANRFGRDTRFHDCAILGGRGTSFSATGNVWDDDGTPVTVRRNG